MSGILLKVELPSGYRRDVSERCRDLAKDFERRPEDGNSWARASLGWRLAYATVRRLSVSKRRTEALHGPFRQGWVDGAQRYAFFAIQASPSLRLPL